MVEGLKLEDTVRQAVIMQVARSEPARCKKYEACPHLGLFLAFEFRKVPETQPKAA